MRNRSWHLLVAVLGLAPLLAASVAHARWPVQPDQFIELTARGRNVAPRSACSDGRGGSFVAWESEVPLGEFLQHIDANGDTLFPAGPCRLDARYGSSLSLVPDGVGGVVALVHHETAGNPVSTFELRALGAAGEEQWSRTVWSGRTRDSYGTRGLFRDERVPGFLVTWVDANASTGRVRVQRFDEWGVPQWGDSGVVVLEDAQVPLFDSIACDDAGGAWLLLFKYPNTPSQRLCLCRVDDSGGVASPPSEAGVWSAGGLTWISTPGIVRDGFGGVYLSRYQPNWSFCIDRFRFDGSEAFAPSGVRLPGDQPIAEPFLASGLDGRVHAAWQVRQSPLGWGTRAQVFDTTGTWLWPEGGSDTGSGGGVFVNLPVFPDGEGGVTLCVDSQGDSLHKVRAAQRFSADGTRLWSEPPPGLLEASPEQWIVGMTAASSTDDGGVIFFASMADSGDVFNLEGSRLVAQRLDRYGRHGDTAPRILSLGDAPDDAGGWLELRWAASCLEGDSAMGTVRYDILRSQSDGAGGTEWVTVAQQPATGLDEYTLAVPTLVDSIAPGAEPTSLRCRAVDADGRTWDSLVRGASSFPNPGALAVDGGTDGGLALVPPAPSPATSAVVVRFTVPAGVTAALEVFDTGGRRVRSVGFAAGGGAERAVPLALVDADGRGLPAGLYLVRLRTERGTLTRRLVVLGAR